MARAWDERQVKRTREGTVRTQVFNLGTWEVMQLALGLQALREANPEETEGCRVWLELQGLLQDAQVSVSRVES